MHTDIQTQNFTYPKTYNWIYWAQIFLFLGVLSSPTVVSLFHILIIIPTFYLWLKLPKIKLSKSSWMLLLLTIWGLIATITNLDELMNPRKSFGELKYYLLGVLLIVPIKYFWDKGNTHQQKKLLNIFWFVIVLAFFVGVSRSWFQFDPIKMSFTDKYHATRSGGFLNYMRYGYASAFIALLGISVHLNISKCQQWLNKKLFYSAIILSFLAIGTSMTRGALLGLLAGTSFLLLRYKPKLVKYIVIIGILLAGVIYYFSFVSPANYRFLNIAGRSNNVRMSQFQTAMKSIQEKPILGLGADQFSYHVKELKKKYNLPHKHYASHAHNILLEHAANYGLIGMGLLCLFFVFWLIEMISLKSAFGWAIGSYITAFFVAGQVELLFDNANSHILFYLYTFSQVVFLNAKHPVDFGREHVKS